MENCIRLIIATIFLLSSTTGDNLIKQENNDIKSVCLKVFKQPKYVIDNKSKSIYFKYYIDTIVKMTYRVKKLFGNHIDEIKKSIYIANKMQRYTQDTCGMLINLRNKIDSIDFVNITKIYNKQDAIDSVIAYFPIVEKNSRGEIKKLSGLLAIIRLNIVWEYLERKFKIPREISISFWIWETGWGKSELFKKHNNFGGIKYYKSLLIPNETYIVWRYDDCYNEKGEKIKCPFIAFHRLSTSINVWGKVLALSRYKKNYKLQDDYKKIVKAYEIGGYWTSNTGYIHRVNTIETYQLHNI